MTVRQIFNRAVAPVILGARIFSSGASGTAMPEHKPPLLPLRTPTQQAQQAQQEQRSLLKKVIDTPGVRLVCGDERKAYPIPTTAIKMALKETIRSGPLYNQLANFLNWTNECKNEGKTPWFIFPNGTKKELKFLPENMIASQSIDKFNS